MKTISLLNSNGGGAKSVSAASIASLLAKDNKKILIIDLDPQANLTSLFREYSRNPIGNLLKQEIIDEYELSSYMYSTYDDNIFIIPGDESLTEAANDLNIQCKVKLNIPLNGVLTEVFLNTNDRSEETKAYYRLRMILDLVRKRFDYVIIDNSSFFSYLTKLSLYASDIVLVPIGLDSFSYEGLKSLLRRISDLNRNSKFYIEFKVFFTDVNSRTILFKSLYEQYKDILGDFFCNTYIRSDNSVREASTVYFPVPDYAPRSNATMDYISLIEEVLHVDRRAIKRIENKLRLKCHNSHF